MNDQNTTPPNAIDLALDALRECERQWADADDHSKGERIYQRSIAEKEAGRQMQRANVLAQVAIAQAIVALTNTVGDGLLSQLAELDADNAALIERLHAAEIEVPE